MRRFTGFLFVLFALHGTALSAPAKEIVLVVHEKSPIAGLTKDQAKAIYLGEMKFIGGVKIKPVDQEDNKPIRSAFLNHVMKTNLDSYSGYWLKRLFQEGGVPPAKKSAPDAVLDAVIENEGAVGYVYKEEAAGRASIRVVLAFQE